jgi:small redox-active disulfide protein 2
MEVFIMVIKILGSGCSKCKQLEANAKIAAEELGIEAEIEKVTDVSKIMDYGVMKTPALVVDEQLKMTGKVLSSDKIKEYLN